MIVSSPLCRSRLPLQVQAVLAVLTGQSDMLPDAADLQRQVSPDLWLRTLIHHRAAPWLPPLLPHLPMAWRDATEQVLKQARLRSLASCGALVRLSRCFADHGLTALAIKGPALAQRLYGDPLQRVCVDLDFLVPPAQLPIMAGLLRDQGYDDVPSHPDDTTMTFRHGETRQYVELHTVLPNPEDGIGDLTAELMRQPDFVTLAGQPIAIPRLEPTLLFLACHGTRHLWNHLFWLTDFAAAMRSGAIQWDDLRQQADRHDMLGHLDLATTLAHDLLRCPLPPIGPSWMPELHRSRILAKWLRPSLCTPMGGARPTRMGFGFIRYTILRLALQRTGQQRLGFARRLIQPTYRDRDFLALPDRLSPLYLLIRPIRVMLDRLQRKR